MQRRHLVVVLIFVLLGALLVACRPGAADIVVETPALDFGDVVNGEIVSREIAVRNTGTGQLNVSSVSTSCGCTTASLSATSLAPGESAVLRVEFDSGAHGPDLTGPLLRQVFIASNDPDSPEMVVELNANILPRDSS